MNLILVNGIPLDFFHFSKGLKQGSSPYPLFLCFAVEASNCLIMKKREKCFVENDWRMFQGIFSLL